MKYIYSIIILAFFSSISLPAKGYCVDQDSLIYESYIKAMETQKQEPINDIIISTAKHFLGKPYVAHTLEQGDKEELIINLHQFDCMTFVENCIALSLVVKSDNHSFASFKKTLTTIRYRQGQIEDYTSRMHYVTEWIIENQANGILQNKTLDFGGRVIGKDINYMSSHPALYKYLANNPVAIAKIETIENNINKQNCYTIIPVTQLASAQKNIRNGDIVAFATKLDGMDYSHIGIAYYEGAVLKFIHASSTKKEIVVENKTLNNYCLQSKSCTGISVLRINE